MNTNGLPSKQHKFIEHYQGNATDAAIKAGYSLKTARQQGQRLLTKVDIAESIKSRAGKEIAPVIASRQRRQQFWTGILENPQIELRERLKASELLAKSEGDFIHQDAATADKQNQHLTKLAETIQKARMRVINNLKYMENDRRFIRLNDQVFSYIWTAERFDFSVLEGSLFRPVKTGEVDMMQVLNKGQVIPPPEVPATP